MCWQLSSLLGDKEEVPMGKVSGALGMLGNEAIFKTVCFFLLLLLSFFWLLFVFGREQNCFQIQLKVGMVMGHSFWECFGDLWFEIDSVLVPPTKLFQPFI